MRLTQQMITAVFSILLLWVLAMGVLPFFVNGWFYAIQSPVPVQDMSAEQVTFVFDRTSRFMMDGRCVNELQCDLIYQFPAWDCHIEQGHNVFVYPLPVPQGATGECHYRGHVRYAPFGRFGPALMHEWHSDPFILTQPEERTDDER